MMLIRITRLKKQHDYPIGLIGTALCGLKIKTEYRTDELRTMTK